LQDWIDLMDEMHRRGMYMIADFTVGTMGDMIGVQEYVPNAGRELMTDISTRPHRSTSTNTKSFGSDLLTHHGVSITTPISTTPTPITTPVSSRLSGTTTEV
jgi:hypothetical protein